MPAPITDSRQMPSDVYGAAVALWREHAAAHCVRIHGNSMVPLLCAGDEVLVERPPRRWRAGDLVVFERDGQLVVHRLLRMVIQAGSVEQACVTQGDNARIADAPVVETQVAGRAVAVRRGTALTAFDTPGWRLLGSVLVLLAQLPWQGPARRLHVRLRRWAARLRMA
jgi:signal peptidase I